MSVDVARGEDLHVTFNLTFPALPCESLLLDAGDVSGKWQTESKLAVARWVAALGCGRVGVDFAARNAGASGRLPVLAVRSLAV